MLEIFRPFTEELVKIVIILAMVSLAIAYLTWLERKVIGHMQVRYGPMRVGWHGLLQPIADGIKFFIKEDIIPSKADRFGFVLAPLLAFTPAFIVFALIPFDGPQAFKIGGQTYSGYVADVNIALLFVMAITSICVLGLILGGWASNSKYPLMGALRSVAQLVSYEVPMGLAVMGVVMMAGSLSLVEIVQAQSKMGWWFFIPQIVGFAIYFICGIAETNRSPFDLPEAENELVGGYHTEYSGFRFAIFFLAEYANMITISAVATTLFLGGWLMPFPSLLGPYLSWVPGIVWFSLKTFCFLFAYLWFRATFPRYRFDQLMGIMWKILLPLAIANILVTAGIILVLKLA